MKNKKIISLLRTAIALAGDGGPSPFTNKEYDAMNKFLNDLEKIVD